MSNPIIVTLDQAPAPLKMVGEEITVLASSEQTGSYEIFRQSGAEGSGPPPHSHPWDEAFYVVEGDVIFSAGELHDVTAKPGTLVHIPGNTTHWFRFGTGGGVMISMTSRAGASAFFTEVDAEISPTDPDLVALVGIAVANGLSVPIPSA